MGRGGIFKNEGRRPDFLHNAPRSASLRVAKRPKKIHISDLSPIPIWREDMKIHSIRAVTSCSYKAGKKAMVELASAM